MNSALNNNPFLILFFISILGVSVCPAQSENKGTLEIAIVRDGPSWYFDDLAQKTENELRTLIEGDYQVEFSYGDAFNAEWKLDRIPSVLRHALTDPDIDIVLTMGILVTRAATLSEMDLPKPVITGVVVSAEAMGLPYGPEGYSTKPNLSFVASQSRIQQDLETFHEMIGFSTVHILADRVLLEGMKLFGDTITDRAEAIGAEAEFIPMDNNAGEVLERVPAGVEAVYLTPPFRMPAGEREKLIEGINERGIPSFALLGHSNVRRGVMAGLMIDDATRVARRIALNIQQVLIGRSPNELPVEMPTGERLVINAVTAHRAGYSPSIPILMRANYLYQDELEQGDPLSLEQAMNMASEKNVQTRISEAEVASARQQKNKPLTRLLPQADVNARYQRIDRDRAAASLGTQPQEEIITGLSVTQIIFDDRIISAFRSAKKSFEAQQYENRAVRLDVMEQSGSLFLEYLKARALESIANDNLKFTQSNLKLARLRQQVGTAGPEEVYRWEAQEAEQESALIQAINRTDQARVALNQSLGVQQDRQWSPVDVNIENDEIRFLDGRLYPRIQNMQRLDDFMGYSLQFALENSPVFQSLEKAIQAQQVQRGLARRRFVLPTVAAQFTYDHAAREEFVDSSFNTAVIGSGLPPFPRPDRDDWFFGVTISYPLFEGGGRLVDLRKAKADLEQLHQLKQQAEEQIQLRTRRIVYALQSSHPNISLSRRAADRAAKNLDVIRDKYARGTVSILDLLDAQNQYFIQDQAATIAVYDYLIQLVAYQRAISWFQHEKTEQEKEQWLQGFDAYTKDS